MKIPSKLPGDLSIRGGSPTFSGGFANYNYAIGGLPWFSAASPSVGQNYYYGDRRIRRVTAPFRKQQFDNGENPGEQSLDGPWIRSQISFHGGAGQLFSDPERDNPLSAFRFYRSKNVDPWTKGSLSLLNATTQATAATAKPDVLELISVVTTDGAGCVFQLRQAEIRLLDSAGGSHVKTSPSAAAMRSCTTNGEFLYISSDDGLWRGPIPSAPNGAITWTKIYTYAGTGRQEVAWVKERIVLGFERSLYELNPNAGAATALPTAFYQANPAAWTWTSISETSPAIYAVGSAGNVSSILKFTLNSTGGLPTLTGGSVAATLPGGEKGWSVFGYLGNLIGIGTSKGARIGEVDSQGNVTYGPLLFESANPVLDWTAKDRFLWCTYSDPNDSGIKLARIDLSVQVEPLRFAWASDLSVTGDSTAPKAVAFYGGTDVLAFATAQDAYREDETKRQITGSVYTSRVRFSTLEPKNFRSFRLRGPSLTGTLGVTAVDNTGVETPVVSFGVGQTPGVSDVVLLGGQLQDFMQLKFTLGSSGITSDPGAMFTGWQLKAFPASPRQRLITLPLWCFDQESDGRGQRVGGEGTAMTRLFALETLESTGGVTTFQDLGADVAYDVFIEQVEFTQVDPPTGFKGFGGVVTVTLRTV